MASPALAGEFCSDCGGVVDGSDPGLALPSAITIDTDCTFQNFPQSNPLEVTINFQTNDPSIYLIIFDNVHFTGHMACASIKHRIWFSNGSDYGSSNSCQDLFIPVESIDKQAPSAMAAIGAPFTYTLTLPSMSDVGGPSLNDLHTVTLWDDLTATGAELTYVGLNAYFKGSGAPVTLVPEDDPNAPGGVWTPKNLSYKPIPLIRAGEQIVVEITVVLEDTAKNAAGTSFINAAKWWFGRLIDDTFYEPLPGEWGISPPMTIVAPDFVVDKTGTTALGGATINLGEWGEFTLDVLNDGTGDAWNVKLLDRLPDGPTGGMCDMTPEVTGVTLAGSPMIQGADYSLSYTGAPTCELTLTLLDAAVPIGPDEHLVVNYKTKLDADSQNGTLINVAGATRWYNDDSSNTARYEYTRELSDGTVATADNEDAHTVSVLLSGYFFEKTVSNVTTGVSPAATAAPGDTLHYTLRLQATEFGFGNVVFYDQLPAGFVPGSLVLGPLPAGAVDNSNPTTGLIDISGLSVDAGSELRIEFDVTLLSTLTHGTEVINQAQLLDSARSFLANSDDPNVNGQANPDPAVVDEDPTRTLITSAPELQVEKTSRDMTGDPAVLLAGDILRYTITVKNTGTENARDVILRDQMPANTTYVPGSTVLNGTPVADAEGTSPLQGGMPVNSPTDPTPGVLLTDPGESADNAATVTFDVVVNNDVVDGTIISNQGFVNGSGAGGSIVPEKPSDDPNTPVADDPTRDIVGNFPLLLGHKTVQLSGDFGSAGTVDPGDVLRYTIVISNDGPIPATDMILSDQVPAETTYVAESLRLNGAPVGADGGVSPLVAGLEVQSSDQPGVGIVSAGGAAEVTFEVRVNDGVPTGTLISNQGSVTSAELPMQPTDADGDPSNGYQPTQVVVGEAQQLTITKEVFVIGGAAQAGGELEYTIRVTNIGTVPATDVAITDDLSPLGPDPLVSGTAKLDALTGGISYSAPLLTANCGDLPPGATAVLRFRASIGPSVPTGTTLTNTAEVTWNTDQTDSDSASVDIGGIPGSGILNGRVWHDANLDRLLDDTENRLEGWSVELYRSSRLLATVLTDGDGAYRLSGLTPNEGSTDLYELRFRASEAGPNTTSLGTADSPFTDGPQQISGVTVISGGNLPNLNLPITPNGAVYDSVQRSSVSGARLSVLNAGAGTPLPEQCFEDPMQQNQLTARDGFYKFDINFSDPSCPPGGDYLLEVTPPASGYMEMPSRIIPPASDETTAPFSIPACPGSEADAVPATPEYCEVTASASVPPLSVAPRTDGTTYHLHLTLSNGLIPGESQVFNNAIPIDPELDGAVAITKTSPMINVTKGQLVPYTITVTNIFGVPLTDVGIVDRFPAGFKYVEGSARLDGDPLEPIVDGRQLAWEGLELPVNDSRTLQLLLIVGAGVSEGEYVNRAQVLSTATGENISGEATATVRVIPDPTFDCTDVIGKVFDDRNLNGYQDEGEQGLAGVRVVTARGLIGTTDEHGRFHITCAVVPDEDRGSNFILKLDDRSLPTGYRVTTENPRVQRATRGKMMKFNFGATIHRVVSIDIADGVFEPETTGLRLQWQPRVDRLLEELGKAPSVLRLSYLADVEGEGLVKQRLKALKREIAERWGRSEDGYRLNIETEVFWRKGGPVK